MQTAVKRPMFANASFCFQTQYKQKITASDRLVSTKYILTFFQWLAYGKGEKPML